MRHNSGFTLLEVMITVSIIAAVITMAISRINNQNNELRSEVRKITTLSKHLHTLAKLKNSTFRIVIDMPEGKDEPHSYWVESATTKVLIDEKSAIGERPKEEDKKNSKDKLKSPFALEVTVMKEPKVLPSILKFEDVEVASQKDPISSGLVYIYYFPQGLVEEAAIHLRTEADHRWTLAVHPLTGRMDITTSYLALKDIQEQ